MLNSDGWCCVDLFQLMPACMLVFTNNNIKLIKGRAYAITSSWLSKYGHNWMAWIDDWKSAKNIFLCKTSYHVFVTNGHKYQANKHEEIKCKVSVYLFGHLVKPSQSYWCWHTHGKMMSANVKGAHLVFLFIIISLFLVSVNTHGTVSRLVWSTTVIERWNYGSSNGVLLKNLSHLLYKILFLPVKYFS